MYAIDLHLVIRLGRVVYGVIGLTFEFKSPWSYDQVQEED
jgi:hypothetical protein